MKATESISLLEKYLNKIFDVILDYSPRFISALLLLFIGLYVIRFINRLVKKIMLKREIEATLSNFLSSSLLWALRILLFVTVISRLGIETSSFVAILGAAGLAVGMSLQGSLSNFAGGVLIILFKPFRVGDIIEAQNVSGTVLDIQIFTTKLLAINNQTIFVPNGILSNGVITNFSLQGYRKADILLSVSHETNLKQVKDIIMNVLQSNQYVLKEPEPMIFVKNIADNAVQLSVKPCANNDDFVLMNSQIIEQIKIALDQNNIVYQPTARESVKK